jgi:sulfide:quinone oxidoreductase
MSGGKMASKKMDATVYDVVIAGGGAAGIGLAASLKSRDSTLRMAIIEPSEVHYYQPSWTLVGGGAFNIKDSRRQTKDLIPSGVQWIKNKIVGFNPESNEVLIEGGDPVKYRQLAIATGIKSNWDAIPGLAETIGKNGVTSNYSYEYSPYTWELVKNLQSGKAIFTQPPMPIKCPGAPQKAMYLSCYEWQKQGRLKNIEVELNNAGAALFGVADFVPPLMEYVKKYNAQLNFNTNLIAVDGPSKKATFAVKDADGNVTKIEKSFDILHVVPPQGPQDCLKSSPVSNNDGFVDVDQYTLQHIRYPNIFGLGDCCSSPNSKTAAAARKQIVVVAENLLAAKNNKPLPTKYDGYGSCPLTVENGKIVLAEFGFGGKLLPTFPWLINPLKATKLAWHLKKDILPWLYWNAMLKGREWLARPFEN